MEKNISGSILFHSSNKSGKTVQKSASLHYWRAPPANGTPLSLPTVCLLIFFCVEMTASGNNCAAFKDSGKRWGEVLKIGQPLQWERRLDSSRRVLTTRVSDKAESQADCWDASVSSRLGDVGLCVEGSECGVKIMQQNQGSADMPSAHTGKIKHKEQNLYPPVPGLSLRS